MSIRPFLCHSRADAETVTHLRAELDLRGAGGWRDVNDLPVGDRTGEHIRSVIAGETGGLIWLGTKNALRSKFVCKIEVPAALGRLEHDPSYRVVPLFDDVRPTCLRSALPWRYARLARGDARRLADLNGVLRAEGEGTDVFAARAATRYLAAAIGSLPARVLSASFAVQGEPIYDTDMTFRWHDYWDARTNAVRDDARLRRSLDGARGALQARGTTQAIRLRVQAPLPMAFLIGARWKVPTGLTLEVEQAFGGRTEVWSLSAPSSKMPLRRSDDVWGSGGPQVLAVSVGRTTDASVDSYARARSASRVIKLSVDGVLGPPEGLLVARAAADALRAMSDSGRETHVLLAGPAALAVLIGALSNATGVKIVPGHGSQGYVAGVRVDG